MEELEAAQNVRSEAVQLRLHAEEVLDDAEHTRPSGTGGGIRPQHLRQSHGPQSRGPQTYGWWSHRYSPSRPCPRACSPATSPRRPSTPACRRPGHPGDARLCGGQGEQRHRRHRGGDHLPGGQRSRRRGRQPHPQRHHHQVHRRGSDGHPGQRRLHCDGPGQRRHRQAGGNKRDIRGQDHRHGGQAQSRPGHQRQLHAATDTSPGCRGAHRAPDSVLLDDYNDLG